METKHVELESRKSKNNNSLCLRKLAFFNETLARFGTQDKEYEILLYGRRKLLAHWNSLEEKAQKKYTMAQHFTKDGKSFDEDNIIALKKGEVEVIQYIHPYFHRRRMAASLGEDYAEKAKNIVIEAVFPSTGNIGWRTDELLISVKFPGQQNVCCSLVPNGPGIDLAIKHLIDRLIDQDASDENLVLKVINRQ